jgi:hypothetical protein
MKDFFLFFSVLKFINQQLSFLSTSKSSKNATPETPFSANPILHLPSESQVPVSENPGFLEALQIAKS